MTQPDTTKPDMRQVLLGALANQREHVLDRLEGLSEEALHRAVLPTGWTPLGLVQHLALDVERFWFRQVMVAEQIEAGPVDGNAWEVGPDVSGPTVLDLYRQQAERADEIIARLPLDEAPAWWPDFFGSYRLHSLGEIIMHVITETACHAGHLDTVRELIDGQTWLILTK
jgi:uncharacterized damage-inducible protein DinB